MHPTPVSVKALNFAFGTGELRRTILLDINLEIGPGEIVILEGPSGSGKTTLLSLICGLRYFQEGSIEIFGEELRQLESTRLLRIRRQIGYIFQHHNLLESLTARRNVQLMFELFPHVTAKEARDRSEQMLAALGLEERLDSLPNQLSGGQRQRVSIARALVTQPKLILADEPTAALDKTTGRQVVDLLQKLARSHSIPVMMVTHDNRILDIADRILRIEDGRLL